MRSSATEAANQGASTVDLKRHFGWAQESTAMKYVDDTSARARKMARMLSGGAPTTATTTITSSQVQVSTSSRSEAGQEVEIRQEVRQEETCQVSLQVQEGQEEKKIYNFDMKNASNFALNFQ
jgi:hypothetical protein